MKASALIGILAGCGLIALGATLEGSKVTALINMPAILIVLGGTFGAVMGGADFSAIKAIPKLYKKVFTEDPPDFARRMRELVGYADRARRDGLLALDEQLGDIEDSYTRRGLQLVVDGTDPSLVAEVLELENDNMRKRHAQATQPFEKAGGYAPTMGIIGTVFGLVHVLENLSQPETLGPSISAAFIATLLGVASANCVYLPMATRLKGLSQQEIALREMTLEGILGVQAGENPRVIAEKLSTFVPPAQREAANEPAPAAGGAPEAEPAAAAA